MLEKIYKKPNLKKIQINSLFASGGKIENLDNFIKIDLVTEYDKENKKMYFIPLFAMVKNDFIQFVYDNEIICKKLVHSFEFCYKIQKTQIKSNGIEKILTSGTWSIIFGKKITEQYFTK
tara:strand:+ start:227 stop:586 length:360 start_codon:yes stop_codon:yes gene_type:complete